MPDNRPNIFARAAASTADFFIRWWREASEPIKWEYERTPFRAVWSRIMLWVPVVVLFTAVVGGAGLYVFTGWRARDLTCRAMDNTRAGKIPLAWVQIMSANSLRGRSPEVRRAMVYVRSASNDAEAPGLWDELAAEFDLNAEEREERARIAAQSGTDEQFAAAVAALERGGNPARASMFRAQRQLRRGNIEQAIAEARAAVEKGLDPKDKMQLLMILMRRYAPMLSPRGGEDRGPVGEGDEIIALVDELQGTDQGNNAVAVALGAFPQPAEKARAWAESAMKTLSPDNPALLPAARYLVQSGAACAQDVHAKLSPVFSAAEPARQADFAEFLTTNGMPEEALALIGSARAAVDSAAFEERGRALAALKRWQYLLALAESAANAPESSKQFFRAWASSELGNEGHAKKAFDGCLRAAAREGHLYNLLQAIDGIGQAKAADTAIIQLCGKAETADAVFRVARDRFGRRGQFASMAAAYSAAAGADFEGASLADYRRRNDLLSNRDVPSSKTAVAVAAAPADISARFTHALALLREGRPGDALGVFHDIDIFAEQLTPGDQAILIKIWEANGMNMQAAYLRSNLRAGLLEKGEYALLLPSSSADNPNP